MGDSATIDRGRLNSLRLARGWTWTELAAEAGISLVTRGKVRRGKPVAMRTLRLVAKALGVPLAQLLADGGGCVGRNDAEHTKDGIGQFVTDMAD